MKKLFFALGTIFTLLTIIGGVFVVLSHGQRDAYYAVIPMVFAIIFNLAWREVRHKE